MSENPKLKRKTSPGVRIQLERGDITKTQADVLLVKHTREGLGLESIVMTRLSNWSPRAWQDDHAFLPSNGALGAREVLFLTAETLRDYDHIRTFVARALSILKAERPESHTLAMTAHSGFFLDERESCEALGTGLLEAITAGEFPPALQTIRIVEQNPFRHELLGLTFSAMGIRHHVLVGETPSGPQWKEAAPRAIQVRSGPAELKAAAQKPHVFVAMPFASDLDDVFYYGIRGPVNDSGYLCERVDQVAFTGDILEQVKSRIETASLVIAELTGANANVYLEVGYAWGKNRPTLLLAKHGEELKFDVKGQRCLVYKSIRDLDERLRKELAGLKEGAKA